MIARRARSSHEKAKAVASIASWLAGDSDHGEPHPDIARAIDTAYSALQVVTEVRARNSIVAMIASYTGFGRSDRYGDVRGFIHALLQGDEYRFTGTPLVPSEAAIDAAIDAWARKPGTPKRGRPTKWEATATLLHECGFSLVAPVTLRTAWDDRNK